MFCDEAGDARPVLDSLADPRLTAGPWAILIGPEGGFSAEENEVAGWVPSAILARPPLGG